MVRVDGEARGSGVAMERDCAFSALKFFPYANLTYIQVWSRICIVIAPKYLPNYPLKTRYLPNYYTCKQCC